MVGNGPVQVLQVIVKELEKRGFVNLQTQFQI